MEETYIKLTDGRLIWNLHIQYTVVGMFVENLAGLQFPANRDIDFAYKMRCDVLSCCFYEPLKQAFDIL